MEVRVRYVDNVFHVVAVDTTYQYEQIFNCKFKCRGIIGELERNRQYKLEDIERKVPKDKLFIAGRDNRGYISNESLADGDNMELLDPENIIKEGRYWSHRWSIESGEGFGYELPPN